MAIDPVCGSQVDEKKTTEKSQFGGRTYYCCGHECKKQFDESPSDFADMEQTGT